VHSEIAVLREFRSAFLSRSSSGLERRISFHESDTFRFVLTSAFDRAMIPCPPSCTSRPHCREMCRGWVRTHCIVFSVGPPIFNLRICSFLLSCRVKGDTTPLKIRHASKTEHQESCCDSAFPSVSPERARSVCVVCSSVSACPTHPVFFIPQTCRLRGVSFHFSSTLAGANNNFPRSKKLAQPCELHTSPILRASVRTNGHFHIHACSLQRCVSYPISCSLFIYCIH
jgi:hypothetical protein